MSSAVSGVPSQGKVAVAPPRPSQVVPVAVEVLANQARARVVGGTGGPVSGLTLRAQHVRPGDLYAAIPGSRVHGAEFTGQAVAAGAVAVLTDRAGAELTVVRDCGLPVLVREDPRAVLGELGGVIYGHPSMKLDILGITGTSGKTTTTFMLDAVLRAAGRTTGMIGTVQTVVAGEVLPSAFTTPEAPDLQALLAVMLERGVTHVPMEVSSHALAMGRVAGTRFTVGAFTNLSQDHLDFHHGLEDYFAAKAKLFDGRSATEIVCIDDDWGPRLVRPGTITVSTTGQGTWTARDRSVLPDGGQAFTASGPGVALPVSLRLPGTFNVANALLAVAILHSEGIPNDAIVEGLAAVTVPGRMQPVNAGQSFTAVVDYSHKPAAVALALDAVRAQLTQAGSAGRIIVVLGCGGDRDVAKRPLMGEAAARRADLLIVTDDNPRSEDPASIRRAMLAGAVAVPQHQRGEVTEVGDRRDAIIAAVEAARPGDVVVVAGKGHETGQEIAGVIQPFSDVDELDAAIRARLAGDPA